MEMCVNPLFLRCASRKCASLVRVIVRERGTTRYKSSLKELPLHTDFIGCFRLACVGV